MVAVQNVRRLVLTGAVVSVTIAGSLYGAGLKTEQEAIQVCYMRHIYTTGFFFFDRLIFFIPFIHLFN